MNLSEKIRIRKEMNEFNTEYKLLCAAKIKLADSEEVFNDIENSKEIIPSERPDMIFVHDNLIIGVEVFEFSSYPSSKRKGNLIKRQESIIEKNNLEERRKTGKGYFATHIETNLSKDNYSKNFISAFNEHYAKINEYKSNLKKINNNNKLYFLIKDCTVDGNNIIYDNKPLFYFPLMNEEIFNFLKNKSNIDGIIFQSKAVFNQNVFFFFKNSKIGFQEAYKEYNKYFSIELFKSNYTKIESFHSLGNDD